MTDETKDCFIIGGPSRNGKTVLADALAQVDGIVAGFPMEALFDRLYYQFYPLLNRYKCLPIEDYLNLERYTNEARTKTRRPADYVSATAKEIGVGVTERIKSPVELVFHVLDNYARGKGRQQWAACDIHPERLFPQFLKLRPTLKQVIMLRDPREAVCAGVYWRSFPERNANADQVFRYKLMLWCYSAAAAIRLKSLYPGRVEVLCFNELLDSDSGSSNRLAGLFGVPRDTVAKQFSDEKPYFTYSGNQFLTPKGNEEELLTESEIETIEATTMPLIEKCELPFTSSVGESGSVDPMLREQVSTMERICQSSVYRAKGYVERVANSGRMGALKDEFVFQVNEVKRCIRLLRRMRHYE